MLCCFYRGNDSASGRTAIWLKTVGCELGEMDDKGLWLISEALDQLDAKISAVHEKENKESQVNTTISQQETINYCDFERGDLMNDRDSLCRFFHSFANTITKPLECVSETLKDGRLISKKMKMPLPNKFLRMAAALVIHHR